ncbi:transposase [Pseudomonas chlororaphis]|uniref:REP-associated tyrosine transposase n=1 Tax=Pseudomonas TaxID=286 RepID=UPI000E09E5A5|nr:MULTISPECIES: transposase [Pseudomonas]AZD18010.1 Transposase [Pseudomonas chlororaphis]WDH46548.1 transposase [Pseudomonas chlororaphis]WDH58395.1 transposase [Pseudomonas chlororaphis]WPO46600.1 transposase [Pseudomonas sp. S1Bt23]WQE17652.1 transposase [Pseudomonas chlororaphis]
MLVHSNGYRLLKGRVSEAGRIYSITVVTHQRRPLFHDFRVGRLMVDQLKQVDEADHVRSLAWVVMPDHLHWLFELRDRSLGKVMCRFKSRSSLQINQHFGCQGRLWQKGYHDRALRKEEDLKAIARYIILNPVRAGLVQRPGDYPLWDAIWL